MNTTPSARFELVVTLIAGAALAVGLPVQAIQQAPVSAQLALLVAAAGWLVARRWPWPGLLLVMASPILAASGGWTPILTWTVVVFAALWWSRRGLSALLLGLATGSASYLAFALAEGVWVGNLLLLAFSVCVAASAVGGLLRARADFVREAELRAQQEARARASELDQRVATERLRIARDLHDSVGHQAAVVSMHLGAAEVHAAAGAPAAEVTADLRQARAGVQSVLLEMQRILEILRVAPEDSLGPLPAHGHVADLVASFTAAGLPLRASVADAPAGQAVDAATAVYRVVQEALTNAQKHGAGEVTLDVATIGDEVVVSVQNGLRDGPARAGRLAGDRAGFGLTGMRERLASVGGWLRTGVEDGQFRLEAHVPIDAGRSR